MARNRYGWEKRAKEMARKQKHDEKLKKRQQGKNEPPAEAPSEGVEDLSSNDTDSAELSVRQDS